MDTNQKNLLTPLAPLVRGEGIAMDTGYVVKKKSRLWKVLPGGRNKFSATLGDTIYLTPERYDDWKSGNPKGSTIALVEHEKVHVSQFRGDPKFKRRYLTSRKWRLSLRSGGLRETGVCADPARNQAGCRLLHR